MLKRKKKTPVSGTIKIRKKKSGVIYLSTPSKISIVMGSMASLAWVISFLIFSIPVIPRLWYLVNPETSLALEKILRKPAVSFEDVLVESGDKEIYQPAYDPTLPDQNRLIVEKLGIDTQIHEQATESFEEALRKGVWRVPELGTPFERSYPSVLVAHRFGYLAWDNQYRRENSFYNLPKLEPGDQVEVIWNKRRYVFEIYGGEESEEISDYTADLILYTCKFLESDERIFRYARLLEV